MEILPLLISAVPVDSPLSGHLVLDTSSKFFLVDELYRKLHTWHDNMPSFMPDEHESSDTQRYLPSAMNDLLYFANPTPLDCVRLTLSRLTYHVWRRSLMDVVLRELAPTTSEQEVPGDDGPKVPATPSA
jgi:hypothetical protein